MSWRTCVVVKQIQSNPIQCLACRRLRAKIRKTLSFLISWTSSGHWATKAHVSASVGCQAIVAFEGDEIVDQLAKETLDHDIDPLTTVRYADLKPLVNSYIQLEVQTKWDVSIHNTRTSQEIPAPDKSWRGCNNPTPNWPHQGHKVPYLVPRTTNNLRGWWWEAF